MKVVKGCAMGKREWVMREGVEGQWDCERKEAEKECG